MVVTSSLCGAAEPPNLVFLLTDDQSSYSLGCYGNPDVKTPNIDRLGNDGMIFDRHYDTTAICMASRVNIVTGKFEFRNGCNFSHGSLAVDFGGATILPEREGLVTFPVFLRINEPGTHTLPAVRLECARLKKDGGAFGPYAAYFNNGLFESVDERVAYDRVFVESDPLEIEICLYR